MARGTWLPGCLLAALCFPWLSLLFLARSAFSWRLFGTDTGHGLCYTALCQTGTAGESERGGRGRGRERRARGKGEVREAEVREGGEKDKDGRRGLRRASEGGQRRRGGKEQRGRGRASASRRLRYRAAGNFAAIVQPVQASQ